MVELEGGVSKTLDARKRPRKTNSETTTIAFVIGSQWNGHCTYPHRNASRTSNHFLLGVTIISVGKAIHSQIRPLVGRRRQATAARQSEIRSLGSEISILGAGIKYCELTRSLPRQHHCEVRLSSFLVTLQP